MLVPVMLISLSACSITGTFVGAAVAKRHNRQEQPARTQIIPPVVPTAQERAACEESRTQTSAAAAIETDAAARARILELMPNCRALGRPARLVEVAGWRPIERKSVVNYSLAGFFVGAMLDGLAVGAMLFMAQFDDDPYDFDIGPINFPVPGTR